MLQLYKKLGQGLFINEIKGYPLSDDLRGPSGTKGFLGLEGQIFRVMKPKVYALVPIF